MSDYENKAAIVSMIPTWDIRIVAYSNGARGRLQQAFKNPETGKKIWQNVPVVTEAEAGQIVGRSPEKDDFDPLAATADPAHYHDKDLPKYFMQRVKIEIDRATEQARRDLMGELFGSGGAGLEKKFRVGDQVEKFSGDYRARGEVRGILVMKKGALRYVVEHEVADGGGSFCHIYSEGQLRLMEGGAK